MSKFTTGYLDPCIDFLQQNPYHAAILCLALIVVSVFAAYKCKWVKRICGRRRNRRKRKSRTHYYYLNKTAGEAADNGFGESLIGNSDNKDGGEMQMSGTK